MYDKFHDLRPHDDSRLLEWLKLKKQGQETDFDILIKPTLNNFRKWSMKTLQTLLYMAYEAQLKKLESSDHEVYDVAYEKDKLVPSLRSKLLLLKGIIQSHH